MQIASIPKTSQDGFWMFLDKASQKRQIQERLLLKYNWTLSSLREHQNLS